MVLPLVPYVRGRHLKARTANTERPVSRLPRKLFLLRELVMNPFRRDSLNGLHRLRQRHDCRDGNQNMNMVLNATDGDHLHSPLQRNGRDKRPESFLQSIGDKGLAPFCAEDAMHKVIDVRMTHERRPSGTTRIPRLYP